MKYGHILSAFAAEPWALMPEKLDALTDFLLFKADGGEFSAEEVAARITKKREAEIVQSDGAVAVIPVYGVLSQRMNMMADISGGTSYQALAGAIRAAVASDAVKAIVLDVDSPGGSVPGTDELASEIRALRGAKPIVAQVNALMASAAYWIGSAADEIVVTPSGRAGSIGVYTSHDDISEALKQRGIKRTYISAGQFKTEGNESEPLGDDARKFVQERVDHSMERFVAGVADGRGVSKSRVRDGFGQGRVFFAEELIDRGMADRIATFSETLERFGATDRPEVSRKIVARNERRAAAAQTLAEKVRAGEPVTKREFEHGMQGLLNLSNSEAERAARLYLRTDQGDPDAKAESNVVLEALRKANAVTGD